MEDAPKKRPKLEVVWTNPEPPAPKTPFKLDDEPLLDFSHLEKDPPPEEPGPDAA